MHPQFRLWFITVPETGIPLPPVIVRYGIKLAWDDKQLFGTNARQSFLTMWNKHTRLDKPFKELQANDVQASKRRDMILRLTGYVSTDVNCIF